MSYFVFVEILAIMSFPVGFIVDKFIDILFSFIFFIGINLFIKNIIPINMANNSSILERRKDSAYQTYFDMIWKDLEYES